MTLRSLSYLFLFVLLCEPTVGQPVPIVDFICPDTVCLGGTIQITNLTTGGSTYYWNFCSGNTNLDPTGINIGNPGNLLSVPGYMTLIKDGNTCYSFITCQGNTSLIRYNHGSSFSNNPVSWTNLGGFGMLGDTVMGIRIRFDNGQWVGILNNNNRLVRLNFGSSVGNTPTAELLGPYAMLYTAHGLEILKENSNWIGYLTCSWGNKLVRLNFGNSLLNMPTLTDLGTLGVLDMPGPFCMVYENGKWYSFAVNLGNNTHTRLTFGNSLLNNPTGVNLGNICSPISLGGITLIRDCQTTTGFQLNYTAAPSPNLLWRLNFPSGITGSVSGTPLGNIGNLNRPSQFSELFRVGDTLFLYATNRQDYTLTRLRFLPCNNASIPSSTLFDPPSFSYNQEGTYNINLIVNEGMPNQVSLCKSIVVSPIRVSLGPDKIGCEGHSITLDPGSAYSGYLWNTGAITQTITVDTAGIYSVSVLDQSGCQASDTVIVTFIESSTNNVDTTICFGESYYCGGNMQTTPGIYLDSLVNKVGCDSIIITHLVVKDDFSVDLGQDTAICEGEELLLEVNHNNASFLWSDGTRDSVLVVTKPGNYWIEVTIDGCTVTDSIEISGCPVKLWFPNAFTPNNDGINDTFKPTGVNVGSFKMYIYNRWGMEVFQTDNFSIGWNGLFESKLCEQDSYIYVAYFASQEAPGKIFRVSGTLSLIK